MIKYCFLSFQISFSASVRLLSAVGRLSFSVQEILSCSRYHLNRHPISLMSFLSFRLGGPCLFRNSMQNRCPKLEDAVPALRPGSLNKMFERIVANAPGNRTLSDAERQALKDDEMTEYTVSVQSRPSPDPVQEVNHLTDTSLPPWVITFDNFISPEECDEMVRLGHKYEYKRSEVR